MRRIKLSPLEELGLYKKVLEESLYRAIEAYLSSLESNYFNKFFAVKVYYNDIRKAKQALLMNGGVINKKWHLKKKYVQIDLNYQQILGLLREPCVVKIRE